MIRKIYKKMEERKAGIGSNAVECEILYNTNIGNIIIMETNNAREAPGSTKTPYSNNPLSPPFPVPLQMTMLPTSGATLQRSASGQPEPSVPQFPSSAPIQPITSAPYSCLLPMQGNLLSPGQGENPGTGVSGAVNNAVAGGLESARSPASAEALNASVANSAILNGILQPTPLTAGGLSFFNPEQIISQDSLVLSQLNSLAEFSAAKGDFANSIKFYERITALDQDNGAAWTALGHCYLLTDNLQKAFNAYQKALYTLPDVRDPQLWYGIGLLYDKVSLRIKVVCKLRVRDTNFNAVSYTHLTLPTICSV
eukprot:TRINITY_DN7326_c0_g3_i7.p1 TRINITY_DN7326_c0_g3~~TRINITY_DN7326_c0_g3_i7.p1  ORF type:complete len:311 (-),score=35.30 TRINITY_DN7326_c0_g3_i7:47-979(-)